MAEALQVNQNSPQSREEIRRVKHIDQLNNALQQMVQLIRQKNMEEKRTHFSKLKAPRSHYFMVRRRDGRVIRF